MKKDPILYAKAESVILTSIHNYFNEIQTELKLNININEFVNTSIFTGEFVFSFINSPYRIRVVYITECVQRMIMEIKNSLYHIISDSKSLYKMYTILDEYIIEDLVKVIDNDLMYFLDTHEEEIAIQIIVTPITRIENIREINYNDKN